MPAFDKGGTPRTPFGPNEYLRSTQDVKKDSYTFAKDGIPSETIDGNTEKVLQPGTVIAKITSGPDAGKVGVYQAGTGAAGTAAVNEVQTITVDATGGTYTLTFDGQTTAAIAEAATAAAVQAALESLSTIDPGNITVTGSAGGPYTVTFVGALAGTNVGAITGDGALLTGGAGTVAIAQTTAGAPAGVLVGAATDGRGDPKNIVGINDTFLPWQLLERDVEIAVTYEAAVVQAWCFEYTAAGVRTALTNTTRDAIVAAAPTRGLLFK